MGQHPHGTYIVSTHILREGASGRPSDNQPLKIAQNSNPLPRGGPQTGTNSDGYAEALAFDMTELKLPS